MNLFPFFYRFTKGQQRGVVALFLVIIIVQAIYFAVMSIDVKTDSSKTAEEKQWLALQAEIDRLKAEKANAKETIYPFNPNYISDYKGYTLGMSVKEIDRLHSFRKSGKFINSAEDFKKVTGVSDSLLSKLSPFFKFPDWVNKKQLVVTENKNAAPPYDKPSKPETRAATEKKIVVIDINDALEEDLDKVYGIGPAFAKKILRRRAQLGGYVSMEQMKEFPEFSPEAVQGLTKHFAVMKQPQVTTININFASLNQLTYFPYFNKNLAKSILTKRSMKGKIRNIEELLDINEFPVDKVKIIALYLEF